jgi:hypothetical protein
MRKPTITTLTGAAAMIASALPGPGLEGARKASGPLRDFWTKAFVVSAHSSKIEVHRVWTWDPLRRATDRFDKPVAAMFNMEDEIVARFANRARRAVHHRKGDDVGDQDCS